jgi:heme a synthase
MGAEPLRRLAGTTAALVFLLMTIGNIVSATGSGLACPDWPLCHGRLIPPLEPAVLIEWSHRLTAALTSIALVATSLATMRWGTAPGLRRGALALLGLFGLQIALGGVTVLLKLPHLISTAHLVNALLILGGLLILAARRNEPSRSDSHEGKITRLVRAGLAVLLVQLALGGYVRHAGAGLACPDFPLCGGAIFPAHALGMVHWTHRWLGIVLLGLFVHIAIAARGRRLGPGASITAALACVQVALGVSAVLLRLDPPIRALHATVGYALWGTLVVLGVRAGLWRGTRATPPGAHEAARVLHAS